MRPAIREFLAFDRMRPAQFATRGRCHPWGHRTAVQRVRQVNAWNLLCRDGTAPLRQRAETVAVQAFETIHLPTLPLADISDGFERGTRESEKAVCGSDDWSRGVAAALDPLCGTVAYLAASGIDLDPFHQTPCC